VPSLHAFYETKSIFHSVDTILLGNKSFFVHNISYGFLLSTKAVVRLKVLYSYINDNVLFHEHNGMSYIKVI
jgi:hypothetical protein